MQAIKPGTQVGFLGHKAQVIRAGKDGMTVLRFSKPLPKWWIKPGSDCMTCPTSQLTVSDKNG